MRYLFRGRSSSRREKKGDCTPDHELRLSLRKRQFFPWIDLRFAGRATNLNSLSSLSLSGKKMWHLPMVSLLQGLNVVKRGKVKNRKFRKSPASIGGKERLNPFLKSPFARQTFSGPGVKVVKRGTPGTLHFLWCLGSHRTAHPC